MDNLMGLDFASEYEIHELIFINSGSNYYVRLPVDMHAALFAGNNGGKTSSLSALKLFLLPEVSFKKQADKFGFKSGQESYEDLTSYSYYLPSAESYIICSASNPKGAFSWVLYRTTNLGYERIAVPYGYDELEHLFWNPGSDRNEGAGELQADINVNTIKKRLISDYAGKLLTDNKSIGQALYTRTSNADDDSRFCMLPMAKGYSTAGVETIRSLLNMAFSLGNASTTSLPQAIGSIIDGSGMSAVKKSNSDGIFLDLGAQIGEWEDLKRQDARLKLIDDKKSLWESLQSSRSQYNLLKVRTTDAFRDVAWSIRASEAKIREDAKVAEEVATASRQAVLDYKPTHTDADNQQRNAISDRKAAEKHQQEILASIARVESARAHLRPMCSSETPTDDEILEVLKVELRLCEEEIEGLQNAGKAIAKMEELSTGINVKSTQLSQLNRGLQALDTGHSILSELQVRDGDILRSLNSDFETIDFTLSIEQRNAIEAFTALFDDDKEKLSLCGHPMAKTPFRKRDVERQKKSYQTEIDSLEESIKADRDQLGTLKNNSILTKQARNDKLSECREELSDLKKSESALKGADVLQSYADRAETRLIDASEAEKLAAARYEEVDTTYRNLKHTRNKDYEALLEAKRPLEDIILNINELKQIGAQSSRLLDYDRVILSFDPERADLFSPADLKSALDDISENLIETLHHREDCLNTLRQLLDYGIVEATPEDRYQLSISQEKFDIYYSDLESVFLNFEATRERYKEQLTHHNNTAAAAARMIENVESIVSNFVKNINDELSGYHISNLSSVKLAVDLHPQYTDMVATLNRIGSRNDQLLSEAFYEQISNFQKHFYIQNPGKIDIAKIIERIRYQFERNGISEDIPQSNGTNCMVNAVLLALFLKRLVPEDLNLSMPVIFDEVGSLDEKNLQEILKVMEEHKLYLFAANPEQNGTIASVLDVYHNLSLFRATDVEVQGKAEVIYFPGMEERLEDITDADSEVVDEDEAYA